MFFFRKNVGLLQVQNQVLDRNWTEEIQVLDRRNTGVGQVLEKYRTGEIQVLNVGQEK